MSSTDQILVSPLVDKEIASVRQPARKTTFFVGSESQQELGESCLFPLGWDEQGQPFSIDLYDPAPGSILVAGEVGCGKTAFLRSLADTSNSMLDVQFGVLTPYPEQWQSQEILPACMGVWPAEHTSVGAFLDRLISWSRVLPATRQVILLLVDGLDRMLLEPEAIQALTWLLVHGTTARVWPFVSVDSHRLACVLSFMKYFPARILGYMRESRTAQLLSGDPRLDLSTLVPGMQFQLISPRRRVCISLLPMQGV